MALTPMDIHNKEFAHSFRGYVVEEVNEFLDRVAKDFEQILRENIDLKDQINQLNEKMKGYQKLEETMHNAIVIAQEAAEEVKQNANREAELIRREADREAQRIVEESRYRSSRILTEHDDLFKQAQVFKMRFRSFLEAQIAALEMEDWIEQSPPPQQPSYQSYQPAQPQQSYQPPPQSYQPAQSQQSQQSPPAQSQQSQQSPPAQSQQSQQPPPSGKPQR